MSNLKTDKNERQGTAIIVGGSLSGLMTAIALSEQGIKVTVLEKAKEGTRLGAGLQVDGTSFYQSKIEKKLRKLASDGKGKVRLWSSIESQMRQEAYSSPNITLHFNTRVQIVDQNEKVAWAKTEEGKLFEGDILIGADGYRSIVRDEVAPHHTDAAFAGYVVWMASVPESEIPESKRPNSHGEDVEMFNTTGGFMFGSVIKDEYEVSRIGCTWYDNTRTELLERLGSIKDKVVHHSVDGKDIPEKDIAVLAAEAKTKWPEPWLTATLHAIYSRNFIGIPIKEYVPETLINNRLVLVGDAAHVPAPVTASGFNESLKDAAVLSECASDGLKGFKSKDTLKKYESLRLKKVQRMVESGRSFSRSYGRYQ